MDIKIRAWDKRNKKFWYSGQEGDVTDDNYQFQTMFNPETGKLQAFLIGPPFLVATDPMEAWDYEHIELPVMHSSITNDDSTKEIYVSDIVEVSWQGGNYFKGVIRFGEYRQDGSAGEYMGEKCKGFYVEATEYIQQSYLRTASVYTFQEVSIIGNIYENPELLQHP